MNAVMSRIREGGEKASHFSREVTGLERQLQSTVAFQSSDASIQEIARLLANDPRIINQITLDSLRNEAAIEKLRSQMRIQCLTARRLEHMILSSNSQ